MLSQLLDVSRCKKSSPDSPRSFARRCGRYCSAKTSQASETRGLLFGVYARRRKIYAGFVSVKTYIQPSIMQRQFNTTHKKSTCIQQDRRLVRDIPFVKTARECSAAFAILGIKNEHEGFVYLAIVHIFSGKYQMFKNMRTMLCY